MTTTDTPPASAPEEQEPEGSADSQTAAELAAHEAEQASQEAEKKAAKDAKAEAEAEQGGDALRAMADPALVLHGQETPTVPGTDLALVPPWREMQGMAAMAVTLSGAQALPTALRNKPNDVFMVLVTARDCGVSLTTALREFHVIDGKVTLSPKVKMAMVNERARAMGWALWPDPDNDSQKASWYATRADRPGVQFKSTFTMAEAKQAGLEGKDNWKKYPQRMLSWRAVGYLLDDVFPEIGTGLYSPDELGAVTDEEGNPVIDVKATDALPGMRNPTGHKGSAAGGQGQAEDDAERAADPADIARLKARIGALPPEARPTMVEMWRMTTEGREPLPTIDNLLHRQVKLAEARVASVEGRAKKGEWGEWAPPADPDTGEVSDAAGEGEASEAGADPMQKIIDAVAAMKPEEVEAALRDRKLVVADDDRLRRLALTDALYAAEQGGSSLGAAKAEPDAEPEAEAKTEEGKPEEQPEKQEPEPEGAPEAQAEEKAPEAGDAEPEPSAEQEKAQASQTGPTAEEVEAIISEVQAMKPADLTAALVGRSLSLEGKPNDRRRRLAEALLRERLGEPEPEAEQQ